MAVPLTTYDIATPQAPAQDVDNFSYLEDESLHSAEYWGAVDTSDGTKGRRYKNDDESELASDPIDFNNAAETGIRRIFIGTVLAASTAESRAIRAYPPNTANISYGVSDTYGQYNAYSSVFDAYYPAGGGTDRTTNVRTGTAEGTPSTVTGLAGDATEYASTEAYDLGNSWVAGYTELSVSALIDPDVVSSGSPQIVASNWDGGTLQFFLTLDNASAGGNYILFPGGIDQSGVGGTFTTAWQHITGTWGPSATILYRNGSSVASGAGGGTLGTASDSIKIANNDDNNKSFIGRIQHVKFFNSVVSSAWDTEESDQLLDNSTFWGTWINVPVGGGTTYDVSIIDIAAPIDSLLVSQAFNLSSSDTATAFESYSGLLDYLANVSDIASPIDIYNSGASIIDVGVSETATATDEYSGKYIFSITLSDTATPSEILSSIAEYGVDVSELATAFESFTSGDLIEGRMCVTISGASANIDITAISGNISITAIKPEINITGKGCE